MKNINQTRKHRQNRVIACLFVATMAFAATTTSLAQTYNLTNSALQNGMWQETFIGGGPGKLDNVLGGRDLGSVPGDQWSFGSGLTLVNVTQVIPGEYLTTYSGGKLVLQAGPWGDGRTFYDLTALNHSISGSNGGLSFDFVMTSPGVSVEAVFNSANTYSSYGLLYNDAGQLTGHTGTGFEMLSITIPDAGSTLVLLGSALLGIVALGRSRLFKR